MQKAGGGRMGVFWSSLNGAGSVVLPFLVFAAFAHLLAPEVFAQFGLALACAELLKTLGPMGLYDVLVAHDERETEVHQTASAVFLGGALVVMGGYCGVLALVQPLFHMAIAPVAYLLVFKILFDYLLFQPQAVLVRRGEVRRLGMRSLVAGAIAGAAGLAIGVLVSPLPGLVIYYVLLAAITLGMTVWGTGAVARPEYSARAFASMRRQTLWASGVRFSGGANSYFDQIIVGYSFPALALGMYNVGKRIEVSVMTLASSLSQILWQPGFARAKVDHREHEVARALSSVALVCGVPVLALAVTAKQAVPLLFGPHWGAASTVVALLAISGLARAVNSVGGAMCTVTSRNGLLLALSLAAAAMNFAIILGFARFGLEMATGLLAARNFLQAGVTLGLLPELRRQVPKLLLLNFVGPLVVVLAVMLLAARMSELLPGPTTPTLYALWHVGLVGCSGAVAGLLLLLRRI